MDCKTVQQKIIPYIERKLSDRELESFLDHIETCETCSEELEVYFTIYYALEKLDQEEMGSFDMKDLLKKDLESSRQKIQTKNALDFTRKFVLVCAGVVLGIILITGGQILVRGSFENTTIYNLFSMEKETEEQTVRETPVKGEKTTEKVQPETNRKKQVIVTTPETEAVPGTENDMARIIMN